MDTNKLSMKFLLSYSLINALLTVAPKVAGNGNSTVRQLTGFVPFRFYRSVRNALSTIANSATSHPASLRTETTASTRWTSACRQLDPCPSHGGSPSWSGLMILYKRFTTAYLTNKKTAIEGTIEINIFTVNDNFYFLSFCVCSADCSMFKLSF